MPIEPRLIVTGHSPDGDAVFVEDRVPDAVKALHSAFELSGDDTIRPEEPFGKFGS